MRIAKLNYDAIRTHAVTGNRFDWTGRFRGRLLTGAKGNMQVGRRRTSARSGARGFTLLEVLIVIAILGIIAVGVVLASQRMTVSAAVSAAKAERQVLQKAVDAMMADARADSIDGVTDPPGWKGELKRVMVGTYDAGNYVAKGPAKGRYKVYEDGKVECVEYNGVSDLSKVNS